MRYQPFHQALGIGEISLPARPAMIRLRLCEMQRAGGRPGVHSTTPVMKQVTTFVGIRRAQEGPLRGDAAGAAGSARDVAVGERANIAESDSKHDRADARLLARLAHVGPALLSPIHTRSAQTQLDLTVIRAREVAVQTRTKIVNAVRGMVESTGHRLPASPTLTFARKATAACPEALQSALLPLIRLVETLTADIAAYDRLVEETARGYPETQAIQTIHGVGALTAVAFVLVLNNDQSRFKRSRDVGCYLGLRPKQRDSGMRSPELAAGSAGPQKEPQQAPSPTTSAHLAASANGSQVVRSVRSDAHSVSDASITTKDEER